MMKEEFRGIDAGHMAKGGESWRLRMDWRALLGLFFRGPLACAPSGSATFLDEWVLPLFVRYLTALIRYA